MNCNKIYALTTMAVQNGMTVHLLLHLSTNSNIYAVITGRRSNCTMPKTKKHYDNNVVMQIEHER